MCEGEREIWRETERKREIVEVEGRREGREIVGRAMQRKEERARKGIREGDVRKGRETGGTQGREATDCGNGIRVEEEKGDEGRERSGN